MEIRAFVFGCAYFLQSGCAHSRTANSTYISVKILKNRYSNFFVSSNYFQTKSNHFKPFQTIFNLLRLVV